MCIDVDVNSCWTSSYREILDNIGDGDRVG